MWVCSRRILSAALAIVLCCIPELGFAMSGQNTAAAQSSDTGTSTEKNVPAAIPDAPGPAQQQAADQANTSGQNSAAQGSQPEGAATARAARTIGGPASKPAGSAIAPAKQRQVRSLLIKLGAIAGAGVALGTVYALTRGTPNKPPGAR